MDKFVTAYLEALFWTTEEVSLMSFSDLSDDTLAKLHQDCVKFRSQNKALLVGIDPAQAGHDFALTRNGHGAGFWDRGLGDIGDQLTKACDAFGEVDLYIGDDGKIYC